MSEYILQPSSSSIITKAARAHGLHGLGDILPSTSSLVFYGLLAFAGYHFLWEGRKHNRKAYKESLRSVGRGAKVAARHGARGARAVGGYAIKRYKARKDSAHYGRL